MKRSSPPSSRTRRRSGLAPLELTLSLPIMLFVMGLIVIIGTTAAWKARTVTNARHSVWRSLWPRTGGGDPFPMGWPNSAGMLVVGSPSDALPSDPFASHVALRGPVLAAPTGEAIPVRESLLDVHGDLTIGISDIERRFPFLANMSPGQIHLRREHSVLERTWAFHEMGIQNVDRRIHVLYPIDLQEPLAMQTAQFRRTVMALLLNQYLEVLQMLDNDAELQARAAPVGVPEYIPPYGIGRRPDYHFPERAPRGELLNPDQVCSYNRGVIRDRVRDPLIPEIRGRQPRATLVDAGVPGRLTRDYLAMYRRHLQHIEQLLQGLDNGSFPPEVIADLAPKRPLMESNKQLLETYITQLEQFEQQLLSGGP